MVRYALSSEFLGVVVSARVAFSKRSWPYVLAMAIPWLLCQGQRCVTRMVQVGGSHRRSLSSYYRFLSDGKFRHEVFWRCLFTLILATFRSVGLLVVVDDTLCPKWGRSIFGTASFFDHVSRPRPGFIWGHNWVVLAVVVTIFGVPVALPFWVQLYCPEKHCRKGECCVACPMARICVPVAFPMAPNRAMARAALSLRTPEPCLQNSGGWGGAPRMLVGQSRRWSRSFRRSALRCA